MEENSHVEASVFNDEDDPFAELPPPLASLPSLGDDIIASAIIAAENGVTNPDEDAAAAGEKKKTKRASRPRLKLNEERLCSPKGIAALKNVCSDVKLKGKGHEASDLNKLLQQFEHWAQCLMPSWTFDSVVRQCEKLGSKRVVQNELNRLRRGGDDDDEEVLRGESEDEEDTVVIPNGVPPIGPQPQIDPPEERRAPLTEEQLEQMRKNRELAMARREALQRRRMLAQQEAESREADTPAATTSQSRTDELLSSSDTRDKSVHPVNEGSGHESRADDAELAQDTVTKNNDQPTDYDPEDENMVNDSDLLTAVEMAAMDDLGTMQSDNERPGNPQRKTLDAHHNENERNLSDTAGVETGVGSTERTVNLQESNDPIQEAENVLKDGVESEDMEYTTTTDMDVIQNENTNDGNNSNLSEKDNTVEPTTENSEVTLNNVQEDMDLSEPTTEN